MTHICDVIVDSDILTLTGQKQEGFVHGHFLLSKILAVGVLELHQGPVGLHGHVPHQVHLVDLTVGERLPAGARASLVADKNQGELQGETKVVVRHLNHLNIGHPHRLLVAVLQDISSKSKGEKS